MPRLIITPNVLNPAVRSVLDVSPDADVEAIARQQYDNVQQWRTDTDGDDHYVVGLPAAPVVAFIAANWWAQILASIALSYVAGRLVAKAPVNATLDAASPTYSIGGLQNRARLGAVIPVVYGQVVMLPDYASQPVTEYSRNEQYLRALFCVGHGDVDVSRMYVGETDSASLTSIASYRVFKPADHRNTMGVIEAATGVYENMFTNSDVADQVLEGPGSMSPSAGLPVGPFEMCKSDQVGDRVDIDLAFAGGHYSQNATTGALEAATVNIEFTFTPVNSSGAVIGPDIVRNALYTDATNTPQRHTVSYALPLGRYRCSARRTTAAPSNARTVDAVTWTGLKFKLSNATTPVYGDVTLVAVSIKATNGVSSTASGRVRFACSRSLPVLDGTGVTATHNPVDAMIDILTAKYGGRRPMTDDELDLAEMRRARTKWAAHNGFNAVFDRMTTVWEAMSSALGPVAAVPLPQGNRISIAHDCVKDYRVALFTDANIVAGSMQIGYEFDKIGDPGATRVEYRSPESFDSDFVTLPPNRDDVETVQLFGCTSRDVAIQHATLANNRRSFKRKTITFETELEGMLVSHGQRIGVSHSTPSWGQSAQVMSQSGDVLLMSVPLDWSVASPVISIRDVEGRPHRVTGVTRGATDRHVVLPSTPTFTIPTAEGGYEGAVVAFGADNKEVTDWIVMSMEPSGEMRVKISAIEYRPEVYNGGMPHQLIDGSAAP